MVQVKTIFFTPYQLAVKSGKANASSKGQIDGVLLKILFSNDCIGYSCLQTWPGLGGSSLEQCLNSMRTHRPTVEAEQALNMAEFEMNWKLQNKRVPPFRGGGWPQHLLVNDLKTFDLKQANGFKTLKIKMGFEWSQDLSKIIEYSKAGFRLRLDFNNQLQEKEFEFFLRSLSLNEFANIEFIEDPFSFNFTSWSRISGEYKINLAWDFQSGEFPLSQNNIVLIHKPMRENLRSFSNKTIVTSNLDHPVGQRLAFMKLLSYVENKQLLPGATHGLNSHLIFSESKYSEQMGLDSQFALWSEPGVGFSDLLEKEIWHQL